jgi:DNA mismatch repair protein MutS2
MNIKALKTLEYNKIIDKLTEYASSTPGKELCSNLLPLTDYEEIIAEQKETSDALKRLWQKGSLSFSGLKDISLSLKRLEIGSFLSSRELLDLSQLLNVSLRVKAFSRKDDGNDISDSLSEYFNIIEPLSPLNNEIKRCIISEDEFADDASPSLSSIRKSIKRTNDKIHSQLNAMLNSQSVRNNLQDFVITMRNGRYCLPVKADCKGNVSGMVHDQSQTGSTLFIEPISVVQLNNELRELEIQEKVEIEKVLATLSNEAAQYSSELLINSQTLTHLDFVFAKATMSKNFKCSEPVFNTEGIINIKNGRHPLLDSKKVVPISVYLGEKFHQLIITGPNTGGKTVSLKTVGLFTLMGQSGLHIPADENSRLSVFNDVFADIGDEQSIEQNLSTFSSHMTNIINILNNADSKSLVLFDEICAGTDPVEGAALAISILTFLKNMKVCSMTTTHYSELKLYAISTEDVENACCEFSLTTLSPTYRLLIGIPGKSNAFAISKKLGLPDFIIDDATTRIDSDSKAFEDLISDLEESRLEIEREQDEIKNYKKEIEKLKSELTKKSDNLDEKKDRLIREANEKANNILKEAKEFADETIRNINKLSTSGNNKDLENERRKLREKLTDTQSKLALKNDKKPTKAYKTKDFKPGDLVKVLSLNLNGTISSIPNAKGDVFVQMGILRSQVNIKDLEPIDEPLIASSNLNKTGIGKIKMNKSSSVKTEVNLIGMTTDEAIFTLDKYLDDAYIAHVPKVRVVHGRGTGALRKAVHAHLKRLKYVKEFRLGDFGEGDTGVTIVEFK